MAVTVIRTCFLLTTTQLLLLLSTASTASVMTLRGTRAAMNSNGAAPPASAVGGAGLPISRLLPLPFSDSSIGQLPHLPFPLPSHGGGGGGMGRLQPRLPIPFPFPGVGGGNGNGNGNNAPADDCLKAVRQAETCVGAVIRSLVSSSPGEHTAVGSQRRQQACCGALRVVTDRCFRGALPVPVPPFRALYAPLVKHACGAA